MKLSIIILSFNTKDLLKQTIDSIPLQSDWELIVVDNASNDGSAEMVEHDYPHIKIIRNNRNLGFAAGNNLGLKMAQGEYVMLLNSDTQIVGEAIQQLLKYLDEHQRVGAITPKITLEDGAIDLACHRGMPTPWNAFTYFTKLERLFPNSKRFSGYHQTWQDFTTIHQVEATSATAMIVRKEAIDQVGLLDERFFFYAEDLDWCHRLNQAGWQIIYYPHAEVRHFKSSSGKQRLDQDQADIEIKDQSINQFYETMKQFYDKHYKNEYPKPVTKLVEWGIDIKKKLHRS